MVHHDRQKQARPRQQLMVTARMGQGPGRSSNKVGACFEKKIYLMELALGLVEGGGVERIQEVTLVWAPARRWEGSGSGDGDRGGWESRSPRETIKSSILRTLRWPRDLQA